MADTVTPMIPLMTKRLVCFDPGEITGCAIFASVMRDYDLCWRLHDIEQFDKLVDIFKAIRPRDFIICEKTTTSRPGFNPVGLEATGVIKERAQWLELPIIMQSPALMQGPMLWPDLAKFRKALAPMPHGRDAFYHGIVFIGLERFVIDKYAVYFGKPMTGGK